MPPAAEPGDFGGAGHGVRFADEGFHRGPVIQDGVADAQRRGYPGDEAAELVFRHGPDLLSGAAASLDPWEEDLFSGWDRLFEEETGFVEEKESHHAR